MIKSTSVKIVPISNIVLNPRNANKHSEEQIERLIKIINFQGFREPLTVSNQSGFLVCGHGRLEAAKKIGMEEVPVLFQDFENEAQEYAHMIADNEIARWAELDQSLVVKEMENLKLDDLDFLGLDDLKFLEVEKVEEKKKEEEKQDPVLEKSNDFFIVLKCKDQLEASDILEELCIREMVFKNVETHAQLKHIKKFWGDGEDAE